MAAIAVADHSRRRKRLTFACNACRARKVRCDDRRPQCTKCVRAGIECITTDPRQPGAVVSRKEAQQAASPPQPTPPTPDHTSIFEEHDSPGSVCQSIQPHHLSRDSRAATTIPAENSPLPTWPRFISGNNLQVMSQWLDLAFARIGVRSGFSTCHSIGAVDQKASRLSTINCGSTINYGSAIQELAQTFLSSANTVFPVFQEHIIHHVLSRYGPAPAEVGPEPSSSSETAIAILVVAIANICSEADNDEAFKQIREAYSMLSIIVAEGSLHSTQALFLLALALRAFDQVEMAWHLITLCISIAQSLAMHRAYTAHRRMHLGEPLHEEHLRTWWAIYSLEKAISLEVERPSSLRVSECNQTLPRPNNNNSVFLHVIGLARIQHQVNERCIQARSSEEDPEADYHNVIREKIVSAGELDQMLLTWADALPHSLRPSNYLYCEPENLLAVSYLAIQYYQTLVLIHRNALLINIHNVRKEADLFCAGKPYKNRIRNGHAVCADAARSIVGVLEATQHLYTFSPLHAIYAPLLATYALAVHTLKYPSRGPARADFELEVRAIEFVRRKQAMAKDSDPHLEALLGALQSQVSAVVASAASMNSRASVRLGSSSSDAVAAGGSLMASASAGIKPHQSLGNDCTPSVAQPLHSDYHPGTSNIASWTGSLPDTWPDNTSQDFDLVTNGFHLGDFGNMDWDALAVAFDLPS